MNKLVVGITVQVENAVDYRLPRFTVWDRWHVDIFQGGGQIALLGPTFNGGFWGVARKGNVQRVIVREKTHC